MYRQMWSVCSGGRKVRQRPWPGYRAEWQSLVPRRRLGNSNIFSWGIQKPETAHLLPEETFQPLSTSVCLYARTGYRGPAGACHTVSMPCQRRPARRSKHPLPLQSHSGC